MNRLTLCAFGLAFAGSLFAQGTVRFDNDVPGVVVTRVHQTLGTDQHFYQAGNGPMDYPPGKTDWGSQSSYSAAGPGFTAQLWAAPTTAGVLQPEGSLQPAYPTTTFRLPPDYDGFVIPTTAVLTGVPEDTPVATLQLRVWDNAGGTVTSWAQALTEGWPRGTSPMFNVNNIGGAVNQPPALTGLVSFNLYIPSAIPEPSTAALAGLGAVALWLWRSGQRKQRMN